MHELSVATSLLELVEAELIARDVDPAAAVLEAVVVRVGPLSGVAPEALESAFRSARGHVAAARGARLEMQPAPLVTWCDACGGEVRPASVQRLACPACGTPTPRVIQGRELELLSLKLADAAGRGPQTP